MSEGQPKMSQDDIFEAAIHGGGFKGDEASAHEVESLRAFLSACREASHPSLASEGLAERALAASTREDLSWRGDLRLVRNYVGDAIRSSTLVRLAAASLLVHLMVIPVVAYFAFTDAVTIPQFRVDVGPRSLPYSEPHEEGLQEPSLADVDEPAQFNTLLAENTLRWGRWQLSATRDPRIGADELVPAWLEARAAILWGGAQGAPATPTSEHIRLFIEAECLLDHCLLGRLPDGSSQRMEALFGALATEIGGAEHPATWLALSALSRAESYGLLSGAPSVALHEARGRLARTHRYRPLLEIDGDLRRRLPLDPLWVEVLAELEPEAVPQAWGERLRSAGRLKTR